MFKHLVSAWRRFLNPPPSVTDAQRVAAEFRKEVKGEPRLIVFVEHPGGWGHVSGYAVMFQEGKSAFVEEWEMEMRTGKIVKDKSRQAIAPEVLEDLLRKVREIGWPLEGKDYDLTDSGWSEIGVVVDEQAHFMGMHGRPIPLDSDPQGRVIKAILECIKSIKEANASKGGAGAP